MNPHLFDKIEAYLDNALSAEEKADFEQAVAKDQVLAEELAVFQLEREGRELLIEAELRKQLLQWNSVEADTPAAQIPVDAAVKKKPANWRLILLFSGFSTFAALMVWLYWPEKMAMEQQSLPEPAVTPSQDNQQPLFQPEEKAPVVQVEPPHQKSSPPDKTPESNSGQLLAIAYYERSDWSDVVRGDGTASTTTSTPLQSATEEFLNKNFASAATILKKIPQGDPYYWQAQDLLGHTLFSEKNYTEAAKVFRRITNANHNERGETARWSLALSLLADGQTNQGTALLKSISDDAEPPIQEQAKALLTELSR